MADRGALLLIGPGWLGAPTASFLATLATYDRVYTVSRRGVAPPEGCDAITGDVTHHDFASHLREQLNARSAAPVAAIVVCVAPSAARGDSYAMYPAAARGAAELADVFDANALVYISSTGVYDRHDGSEVDEHTPIVPSNERVQALHDAELVIVNAATATRHTVVLRPAGLYGPGRDPGPRFASGATPAHTWCNFSWRDDVTSAIAHVLRQTPTGAGVIYNCTDDRPVPAGQITQALTGAAMPANAFVNTDGAVRSGRSNQRISSRALIASGWTPRMPSVFDGLRALGHALPGLDNVTDES